MLSLYELLKNKTLLDELTLVIEYTAYDLVSKGLDADIGSVYKIIRSNGIEVDAQVIGYIYNKALPKEYSNFSDEEEVDNFVSKDYSIENEIINLEDEKIKKSNLTPALEKLKMKHQKRAEENKRNEEDI